MSRFYESGDGENWDYIRWAGARKMAFNSKYGQERLREFEEALLALPEKRLSYGHLIEAYEIPNGWPPPPEEPDVATALPGDVCAVGAFCAYKMGEGDIVAGKQILFDQRKDDLDYDDDQDTVDEGVLAGLRQTMAWEIGFRNDDSRKQTPEQRYEYILAYIRGGIRPVDRLVA